jgi:hypothetical protein
VCVCGVCVCVRVCVFSLLGLLLEATHRTSTNERAVLSHEGAKLVFGALFSHGNPEWGRGCVCVC